jgi:hypothetical protein
MRENGGALAPPFANMPKGLFEPDPYGLVVAG